MQIHKKSLRMPGKEGFLKGMHTRTKMICTIGPAVQSEEKILELIEAGMDVARLNFSHGTHEMHAETIRILKKARDQLQRPLASM